MRGEVLKRIKNVIKTKITRKCPGGLMVRNLCFHCTGHRFRTWPGNYLPKVIKIMRWGIFLDYLGNSGIFTKSLSVGPGRVVVEEKVGR